MGPPRWQDTLKTPSTVCGSAEGGGLVVESGGRQRRRRGEGAHRKLRTVQGSLRPRSTHQPLPFLLEKVQVLNSGVPSGGLCSRAQSCTLSKKEVPARQVVPKRLPRFPSPFSPELLALTAEQPTATGIAMKQSPPARPRTGQPGLCGFPEASAPKSHHPRNPIGSKGRRFLCAFRPRKDPGRAALLDAT
jgi:hypothetical protein